MSGKISLPKKIIAVGFSTHVQKKRDNNQQVVSQFDYCTANSFCLNSGKFTSGTTLHFDSLVNLWNEILQMGVSYTSTWLVGFRLDEFIRISDFFSLVDDGKVIIETLVDECPPLIIEFKHNKNRFFILGLENYVTYDRKKIGKELLNTQWSNFKIVSPGAGIGEDSIYQCMVSKYVAEKIFGKFGKEIKTAFKLTTGSISFNEFKENYCAKQEIHTYKKSAGKQFSSSLSEFNCIQPHKIQNLGILERAAIYSPQSEPFFIGKIVPYNREGIDKLIGRKLTRQIIFGPIFKVDCNSLYPFILYRYPLPYRLRRFSESETSPEIFNLQRENIFRIAGVSIKSKDNEYPVRLPGGVMFCRGTFQTILSSPEFEKAITGNDLTRIHWFAEYDSKILGESFVERFYKLKTDARNSGEYINEAFHKVILNSLWGKFCQQVNRWEFRNREECRKRWGEWVENDPETKELFKCRGIAGIKQIKISVGDSKSNFNALSVGVNSYARGYIDSIRQLAGVNQTLYQSVDGLILTESGYHNLMVNGKIHQDEIGEFKLEKKADSGEILGRRHYRIGDEVFISGIRNEHIFDLARKYKCTWKQSLAEFVEQKNKPVLIETAIEKNYLSNNYTRYIMPDGFTKSFIIGNDFYDKTYKKQTLFP
jgi:hypothetical protein